MHETDIPRKGDWLFTLEPQPRGGDRDRTLLDSFGYTREANDRSKELYSTLSCRRYNAQNVKLAVEKDVIRIVGKGKRLNIYWGVEDLQKKFEKKIPALVYVSADQKHIQEVEYFHFNEAYLLEDFSFAKFKEMVKKDEIVVDLRMYYRPNGSVRNHGTAFRVKTHKIYNAFKNKKPLL